MSGFATAPALDETNAATRPLNTAPMRGEDEERVGAFLRRLDP